MVQKPIQVAMHPTIGTTTRMSIQLAIQKPIATFFMGMSEGGQTNIVTHTII